MFQQPCQLSGAAAFSYQQHTTWQVYGFEGELVAEYAAQAHALLPQKEYGYQNGKMLISAVNGDETRLRRFVENFYQRTWLTLPDQATLQNHINALAAQGLISHAAMLTHAQQFGASLFTSTTYLNRNTTNGMYIADLYLAYLQRPPDEGGFEYWKEVLDNNQISRATLRDAFAGYGYSPSEYGGILEALRASGVNDYDRVDRFVNYVYTVTSANGQTGPTTAQRDAERTRFDVAEAQNREAVRTAAEQLGTELLGASANNYRAEWSHTEYVRRLYETFLRHAPDTAGWEYWTGQAGKQGRAPVLGAFLEAGAYREQADALYREIYWLVGDQLGTPRMIVSRTGSLASVKRHDYLPFGEELPVGAGGRATSQGYVSDSVRQQFTGYERDDETSLDYAQARYMSSAQGRFTGVDPLLASGNQESPQSWNRYTYCHSNPLIFVDPDGTDIQIMDQGAQDYLISGLPKNIRNQVTAAIGNKGLLAKGALNKINSKDANFLKLKDIVNAKDTVELTTAPDVEISKGNKVTFFKRTAKENKEYDIKEYMKANNVSRADAEKFFKSLGTTWNASSFYGWTQPPSDSPSGNLRVVVTDRTGEASQVSKQAGVITMGHELYIHAYRFIKGQPFKHGDAGGPTKAEEKQIEGHTRRNFRQK